LLSITYWNQVSHNEIIFLSEAYELDRYPKAKLKNYHRLLQEIICKIARAKDNKIYFNDLTIYSLMIYLSDIAKDTKTKDKGITFNNSIGYLCGISKRDYAGLFLYNKELIIKDSKTFIDIKDIRFNRQSELKQLFILYPERVRRTQLLTDTGIF
jgi:predicted transcriptional regulator with HTH domain